jgi:transposase-like protein
MNTPSTLVSANLGDASWYGELAMEPPACPRCGQSTPVALLSKVEKGKHSAQTWVCRDCLSSFGNIDEWRRQIQRVRNTELIRAGMGIAALVGVSVLLVRRLRRTVPQVHSPAFV